ncbi:MAG: hypothetical protein IKO85_05060 [Bacteroidaceae bacterium]|nr:hypothetical protein [Bacteroidaceae bacterium]
MARRKSLNDIMEQNRRIQSQTSNAARIERVASATRRYSRNINNALNPLASQGVPMYGKSLDRKVSRSTYMGLNAG